MIINDLDGYYIVFDTKNWNTELDTLMIWSRVLALSKILKSGCLKNRVESVAIVGVGWNILIIHNMW